MGQSTHIKSSQKKFDKAQKKLGVEPVEGVNKAFDVDLDAFKKPRKLDFTSSINLPDKGASSPRRVPQAKPTGRIGTVGNPTGLANMALDMTRKKK